MPRAQGQIDQAKMMAIVDAAIAQMADVGVLDLRIGDVARVAGVSKQTVYNNFGTKARVVEEAIRAVLVSPASKPAHDRVRRLWLARIALTAAVPTLACTIDLIRRYEVRT